MKGTFPRPTLPHPFPREADNLCVFAVDLAAFTWLRT